MFQRWFIAVTAVWLSVGAVAAQAQDMATVQMRDGTKLQGRIDGTADGNLVLRVSHDDQRRLPLSSVALIDRVGGASGLPATELREAAGAQHLLLMSNGSSMKGQLVAIRGGQGSANESEPRTYVFRSTDGREQRVPKEEVSRVYLGTYPVAALTGSTGMASPAAGLQAGNYTPGSVRVPAAGGWVDTGMRVRRGERILFTTSGEVQLSENSSDRAHSAGATREAPNAPLPSVAAGALIGRIGNSAPFGIGDQAAVPMPFDGILYLAVNDDERSDNAGEFIVQLRRSR